MTKKRKVFAPTPAPPPDKLHSNINSSRLCKSEVAQYCIAGQTDCSERFNNAVKAFRREASVLLDLFPVFRLGGTVRYQSIKLFTIKVLLFIGVSPNGNGLAVLARLIEILTAHPEISMEEVIDDFAKTHSATVDGVTRVIEKNFNVYNQAFYERVESLTGTHPMTAKDVLCDLSVYIRAKYMTKPEFYE